MQEIFSVCENQYAAPPLLLNKSMLIVIYESVFHILLQQS